MLALVAVATSCFAQEEAGNIEFVENKGQWDSRVNFKGEMSTGAFFLQKTGFTVLLHNPADLQKLALHGVVPPAGGWDGGQSGKSKRADAASSGRITPFTCRSRIS